MCSQLGGGTMVSKWSRVWCRKLEVLGLNHSHDQHILHCNLEICQCNWYKVWFYSQVFLERQNTQVVLLFIIIPGTSAHYLRRQTPGYTVQPSGQFHHISCEQSNTKSECRALQSIGCLSIDRKPNMFPRCNIAVEYCLNMQPF